MLFRSHSRERCRLLRAVVSWPVSCPASCRVSHVGPLASEAVSCIQGPSRKSFVGEREPFHARVSPSPQALLSCSTAPYTRCLSCPIVRTPVHVRRSEEKHHRQAEKFVVVSSQRRRYAPLMSNRDPTHTHASPLPITSQAHPAMPSLPKLLPKLLQKTSLPM